MTIDFQKGFTLVELIMVIILVGIISVYAASRFDTDAYDAEAAAGEVIEAIRYAQSLAMQHSGMADSDGDGNQDYYSFRINDGADTYTVAISDSNSAVVTAVANPISGAASYTQSWAGGVTLSANIDDIFFTSRGEPVTSAGNPIAADVSISITTGGSSETVTVEQISGFASR